MTWGAAAAKAKFSALLDEAESNGPQLVQRRKTKFLVVTEEQWDQHVPLVAQPAEPFVSVWESLRVEPEFRTEGDIFIRHHDQGRDFSFE